MAKNFPHVRAECLEEQVFHSQALQKLAKQLSVSTNTNMHTRVEKQFDDNGSKLENTEPVANWRERRAAVLICLFEGDRGELRVILTKRSMKLSSHPGDVALPGGKMEEGDSDDSATALREAMEEVGLDPGLVQVIANLEPFISQKFRVVEREGAVRTFRGHVDPIYFKTVKVQRESEPFSKFSVIGQKNT